MIFDGDRGLDVVVMLVASVVRAGVLVADQNLSTRRCFEVVIAVAACKLWLANTISRGDKVICNITLVDLPG